MNNDKQQDMFAHKPDGERIKYKAGSDTSKKAADSIRPSAGTLREKVLEYIEQQGKTGATDEEVQDALNLNPSTQRPRRIELVERGLVRDANKRRKTRSGRTAAVWISTDGE